MIIYDKENYIYFQQIWQKMQTLNRFMIEIMRYTAKHENIL